MSNLKYLILIFFQMMVMQFLNATPSTQIWNPSTDIQRHKTLHLGVDNYFSVLENDTKAYAYGTDIGFTYGLFKNIELGIDLLEPTANPIFFNAKYGLSEYKILPALALGIFNVGTNKDATNSNIIYGLVSKIIEPIGRLSYGYYKGNGNLLIDEMGKKENTGLIVTWDKQLTDKVWTSIDYASGDNFYGALSFGSSYSFAPNISFILGYVVFNNDTFNPNNTITTQLDVNF